MKKKGLQWHILIMFLIGLGLLLVSIGGVIILRGGAENLFSKIMEILRFG
ncbi:hypothetical protein HYU11_01530 [Candidatus Woesearchaeota archaeon]|nr:hypothetical protein [Candidatus Woesearchaeota archaeon]